MLAPRLALSRSFAILAAGLLLCALPAIATCQAKKPDAAATLGCGKARSLAQRYLAGQQAAEALGHGLLPGGPDAVLPDDTDLLHCDVEIQVLPDQYENLVGTNTMTIQSKRGSLGEFIFRLRSQFTISAAEVDGTPVTVTTLSESTRLVTLPRIFGYDEIFHLMIAYHGHAVSGGFGSIEFTSHSGSPIVYTLSEPYYAHTWWPVKDGDIAQPGDNGDKFTLDLALIAPDSMVTASNGLLVAIEDVPPGQKRYRWRSLYPISPYLVCFSSTNYTTWSVPYVTLSGDTMPVDFYIYPESDNPGNRAAWEACVGMLTIFRDLYGEYPFVEEKYGIYQCNFGGGMEHQTFTAQGGFWDWVTAHELSHQWWGDLVTCKTWNDIWLNEGFASYSEALWVEHREGSGGLPDLKNYMAGKKYFGGGSVYVTDAELGSLWDIFDGNTSYNKGAWVLHMVRHVLGDASFFTALAAYRETFAGSAATTADFQKICEQVHGAGLDWFFQEWVYGEYAPAYEYGWTTRQVNGRNYLLLDIDQVQSPSYQRFEMPIDVVADGQVTVVLNDADFEHFVIPLSSPPTTVWLDPDSWVLASSTTLSNYVPGPPKVVETSPAPGGVIDPTTHLSEVVVRFHTNVTATAADFELTGENGGPIAFTISPGSNVDTIVLTATDPPLHPDLYTFTIKETVVAVDSGMLLDGEVSDPVSPTSLPSGDGLPGGAALTRFTITGGWETSR
ncbi:MAG: M1 family aminopeptidase [Planctomycetota bacterium]